MGVTLIGLILVTASAIYVAWPLLSGSEAEDAAEISEASALEKEKDSALDAIREIDFDLRVGKISEEDHAALRADLEKRALKALAELDEGAPEPELHAVEGGREGPRSDDAAGFCASCGNQFKKGARFCAGCGKRLPTSARGGARRRA